VGLRVAAACSVRSQLVILPEGSRSCWREKKWRHGDCTVSPLAFPSTASQQECATFPRAYDASPFLSAICPGSAMR